MKGKRNVGVIAAWLVLLILAMPAFIAAESGASVFHGNTASKVFHRIGCRHYNCSKCTAVFHTKQSAVEAGYRPCKICKP
ncbi:Ada metal-binding domain-containing protein [Prosthecochloris sp. SCSIO W1101]|uniref:Ada metal-binding domain-containing protein n=1 Tax=Prosthecochloris sp. SCSIO W1101 TaxID=2992242 RepID=UPI00223D9591|nr:Ada metal-binding domain-containing protein [Prosthecochloris sp. SCSIO W1101]UZJ40893.1 Ada metal-binding domain-containing protein [Prosthecochloris sp. SCSIO W1101]